MLTWFQRLLKQHRHVVIVLKPGEAAVLDALMIQVRDQWKAIGYTGSAYLERAMQQFDKQVRDQMTQEMAEDATEDIAIAQAIGEYPETGSDA